MADSNELEKSSRDIPTGVTFHRTFSLVRSAVSSVLKLAYEYYGDDPRVPNLTRAQIRERTKLGTIYVEAMPRYAKVMGLLDDDFRPTPFGRFAYKSDPLLNLSGTQWLMHYHISCAHGVGPTFWNALVNNRFRSGNEFVAEDIEGEIYEIVQADESRELSERDARSTARVFLGTYLKADAFSELGILQQITETSYKVLEPEAPSVWVIAYAILDYWRAAFPEQITVSLNELSGAQGVASLFLIGSGRLNGVLREMQDEGYVEVHRLAPPYQVVLLNSDCESVLERIYRHE